MIIFVFDPLRSRKSPSAFGIPGQNDGRWALHILLGGEQTVKE